MDLRRCAAARGGRGVFDVSRIRITHTSFSPQSFAPGGTGPPQCSNKCVAVLLITLNLRERFLEANKKCFSKFAAGPDFYAVCFSCIFALEEESEQGPLNPKYSPFLHGVICAEAAASAGAEMRGVFGTMPSVSTRYVSAASSRSRA